MRTTIPNSEKVCVCGGVNLASPMTYLCDLTGSTSGFTTHTAQGCGTGTDSKCALKAHMLRA